MLVGVAKWPLVLGLAGVAAVAIAAAGPRVVHAGEEPVLHEPIPPDPTEDLALHVALEGDLPAAIQTPHAGSGVVSAPDPLRAPAPDEASYGPAATHDAFVPDRDTSRPVVSGYDEPFTPSTAPFKRLEAFDAVRPNYELDVRDSRLVPLAMPGAAPRPDEDAFYADLVIDLAPEGVVRVPTVGPGARIVRGRLGVGDTEVPFRILRDGADNWFLEATTSGGGARHGCAGGWPLRARLVMELAIRRASFGGTPADVGWNELPFVAPLPTNVARDATVVRSAIGVSRAMAPRQSIARLVDYFRGFKESAESPASRGSVYLDLALSRKGVCRHRAFAFLVTAQSLGIPTRLIENEAHAWVEINDGTLWRRIDLGGAGQVPVATASRIAQHEPYEPPADAYAWPPGAGRGDEVLARTSPQGVGTSAVQGRANSAARTPTSTTAGSSVDSRTPSAVTLAIVDATVHRGSPVHFRGDVRAGGERCPHVAVAFWLRDPESGKRTLLGMLATGDDGAFDGSVVPADLPLGDYEVSAETPGDTRCGRSQN